MSQWHPQAYNCLINKDYVSAITLYEEAIADNPTVITNYFYLGLLQLLQGQETEAQFTWMICITDEASMEQIDIWTSELVAILYTEAERQRSKGDYQKALLICQHIHEIDNSNLDNSLVLVWLLIQSQTLDAENSTFIELIENLNEEAISSSPVQFNQDLLWHLLVSLLEYEPYPLLIEFAEVCLPFVQNLDAFIANVVRASMQLCYFKGKIKLAIGLLQLCLRLSPEHLEVSLLLCSSYHEVNNYNQEVEIAKHCCQLSANLSLVEQLYPNVLLTRALFHQVGSWQEGVLTFNKQEALVSHLIAEQIAGLSQTMVNRLYTAFYFAPYIKDEAKINRLRQNQVAQLCQNNTKVDLAGQMQKFSQRDRTGRKKLRLGYISYCMAQHSVGWLARWLIHYHDREQFELYGYFQAYRQNPDPLQAWYESQMDKVHREGFDSFIPNDSDELADRIYQDQIDILIDLDSITLDITCGVMARKPAPIQVTWLGFDASGIPAIDYFIADPYVLPDSAQEYYSERIWRLPQTYIAVDGFEVGIPNLRRDQLAIPDDAVVYLSAQPGLKRHIDTVHLQMQIIKSVPNSYFLIKGLGDQDSIKDLFSQVAIAEGVDTERLRFLPRTLDELTHRANLGIADVVLDTYPYNGATTTLETLWMCIPLVTRVGEQFAARNSYTMMVNAGISEGIAWSDAEYIEWGIRLGQDASLREDIAIRLKASRQTSPLWNGEKFARDMENAYQQMWQLYMIRNAPIGSFSHTS